MSQRGETKAIILLTVVMTLGYLLAIVPEEQSRLVRNSLRDSLTPAVTMIRAIPVHRLQATLLTTFQIAPALTIPADPERVAELERELSRAERTTIALQAKLESASDRASASSTSGLFQPTLVEARILGDEHQQFWKSAAAIDVGDNQDLREHDWILAAERPLIDLGFDHELRPDQLILSGRMILGQIHEVGRWSSTIRPVTDREFRCPARVIKPEGTSSLVRSPLGSLHGLGDGQCTLRYIPNTAPVSVGDFVILDDPDDSWEEPVLLGRVQQAEIEESNPFWDIDVRPIALELNSRVVHVLTEQLSKDRLAGSDSPFSGTAGRRPSR